MKKYAATLERRMLGAWILVIGLVACDAGRSTPASYEPEEAPASLAESAAHGVRVLSGDKASAQDDAAQCSTFMASTPPPKPGSSPTIRFWPDSDAGRYHENLQIHCARLWAGLRAGDHNPDRRALGRAAARQFFEHCLGSMSRRQLSEFETKLYCFDMNMTPMELVAGHPPQHWAYLVYRTASDKDAVQFRRVAEAVCEKMGSGEACSDAMHERAAEASPERGARAERTVAAASR